MTRSILCGLLGLISVVTLGTLPVACQSGGVGDPCTPEDEYQPDFAGFKMTEENIESRSFQCATRICLVNHFQGRVSCPLGQPGVDTAGSERKSCKGLDDKETCGTDASCVESTSFVSDCTDDAQCTAFEGLKCDTTAKLCTCDDTTKLTGSGYTCVDKFPRSYVCHKTGNCQHAEDDQKANAGKDCCVPGTDKPVAASVCSQCGSSTPNSKPIRGADQAVYCSCRCGLPTGGPDEPNSNLCACPSGFTCSEIRPYVGLGDPLLAGKYCIRDKTEFTGDLLSCQTVPGYWDSSCDGAPSL